jgi:hypothetical protein
MYAVMLDREARSVVERVGNWPGLIEYASKPEVPNCIIPHVRQLPVCTDG